MRALCCLAREACTVIYTKITLFFFSRPISTRGNNSNKSGVFAQYCELVKLVRKILRITLNITEKGPEGLCIFCKKNIKFCSAEFREITKIQNLNYVCNNTGHLLVFQDQADRSLQAGFLVCVCGFAALRVLKEQRESQTEEPARCLD